MYGITRNGISREADAIDLPGHPAGTLCTSVEAYADWLHGYIKQKEYERVVLAGHSLGGGIALMHAYKYPQDLKGDYPHRIRCKAEGVAAHYRGHKGQAD